MKQAQDMTQNDFVVKEDDKVDPEVFEKAVEAPVDIPSNYIKIKLSSCGKLSAPPILHFRNYTMSETIELASLDMDNYDRSMIAVLNSMVFEDFDCGNLHKAEVVEILLNIHAAFWGDVLENPRLRYYVDESLEDPEKNHKSNISVATIPIKNIKTKEIMERFKEPFYLESPDKKIKVGFKFPRLKNSIIANRYIDTMFAAEEKKFGEIKYALEWNRKNPERPRFVDWSQLKPFEEYRKKRAKHLLKVYQTQLVHSINGKVYDCTKAEDIKLLLDALNTIAAPIWENCTKKLKNELHFGVNPEVEFECSITHKKITRRFEFRELDFIPSVDEKRNEEYTLLFD